MGSVFVAKVLPCDANLECIQSWIGYGYYHAVLQSRAGPSP